MRTHHDIIQGNALAELPKLADESVHAVIADPPYSSGGSRRAVADTPSDKYCQGGKTLGRPCFLGDQKDQRSHGRWCAEWLTECYRIAKDSAYLLCFTDWRQLPTMTDAVQWCNWAWRGIVAWDKGRAARAPHKGYFRHQAEYLIFATKGKVPRLTHAGPFDGVIHAAVKQKDKHHMTGKPTALLRELVQCVPEGSTVLDPFAGSGTTGVACKETGRSSVQVELSEEYVQIARDRLRSARRLPTKE